MTRLRVGVTRHPSVAGAPEVRELERLGFGFAAAGAAAWEG